MRPAIRTEALTKFYGANRGVEQLDLEVPDGAVFGFLGPNGAGKTTTIRLLLDLIRPTSGRAEVVGLDAHRDTIAIRRQVGFLPGELSMYERLTGRQLLTYLANLRGGVDGRVRDDLAERFDVSLDRPIRELSMGNKQKLGVVQAFMHEPELLILDEPTIGLDPLVQLEFQRLLREVRDEGRTVFLSSHSLAEVERVADRVGIIRDGRLVEAAEVRKLKQMAIRRIELEFAAPAPREAFATLPGVREAEVDDGVLRLQVEGSVDAVIKTASRYEVVSLATREADLEEVFLTYYRGGETAEPEPAPARR